MTRDATSLVAPVHRISLSGNYITAAGRCGTRLALCCYENMSLRSTSLVLSVIAALAVCHAPTDVAAKSYPRDGRFKQLPSSQDSWYFIDWENWYIKAPDKWTHFMGSYALTEVIHAVVRKKRLAGLISLGFGIAKEFDDAYREGWSTRDLYMDVGGVASSILLPDDIVFIASYDKDAIMFRLSFIVD